MIKRVISESKKLGRLKSDSARLLYSWLIPWLDVEGRHSADPEIIKGHIFPKIKTMTTRKIKNLVLELNEGRLIILYSANDELYLQFKKSLQKIQREREAPSTIPDPKQGQIIKPTHENSGVGHENSTQYKLNKLKLSKVKCSENHSELAALLESKIKERIPKHRFMGKDYLKKWADIFRLMEEKEEATCEEIKELIIWISKDDFWYKNVLSAEKLRKQFGRLWAEMGDDKKRKGVQSLEEFDEMQERAMVKKK